MTTESTEHPAGDSAEQACAAEETKDHSGSTRRAAGTLVMGPFAGLLFALVGGGIAWAVLEACMPVFTLPEELQFDLGPPPDLIEEVAAAENMVEIGNRVFGGWLVGGLLGAMLGIGEGISRRCLKTLLVAGIGGGLIAALVGCGAGLAGHYVVLSRTADLRSVTTSVIVQCAVLGILGAGIGLTFGLVTRRFQTAMHCLGVGLAVGLVAAILYPVSASFLVAEAQTQWPVPLDKFARLLWIGWPATLLGIALPLAVRSQEK